MNTELHFLSRGHFSYQTKFVFYSTFHHHLFLLLYFGKCGEDMNLSLFIQWIAQSCSMGGSRCSFLLRGFKENHPDETVYALSCLFRWPVTCKVENGHSASKSFFTAVSVKTWMLWYKIYRHSTPWCLKKYSRLCITVWSWLRARPCSCAAVGAEVSTVL